LITVTDLDESTYSFDLSKEEEAIEYSDNIQIKTLGEVCELKNGTNITKADLIEGEYPVIGGGQKPLGYHNKFNCSENTLIISKDGAYAGYVSMYNTKLFTTNHGIIILSNDEIIQKKYLYYYLKNIQNDIYKLQSGAGQPGIKAMDLQKIKIPIPSLEKQNEIVETLDEFQNANYNMEKTIEHLKNLNKINVKISISSCIDIQIKTLGEVCEFDIGGTPLRKNKEYYDKGTNLWVSVRELNGGYIYDTNEKITDLGVKKSSVKLFKKDTVLFSFKLSIGKTAIVGNTLYSNEAIAGIFTKDETILINKYLYYYLTYNDFTNMANGIIGNGSLNKSSLALLKIPIPSLEKQNEIVEYCDRNQITIDNLEKTIEDNKKLMKQVFTQIEK